VETLVPPPVFHTNPGDQPLLAQASSESAQTFQQLTASQPVSAEFLPSDLQAQTPLVLPADIGNNAPPVLVAPPTVSRAPSGSAMLAGFATDTAAYNVAVQVPGASGSNDVYLDGNLLPSGQVVPIGAHDVDGATINNLVLSPATPVIDGQDTTHGIIWGRWQGNFTVNQDGTDLAHNQNLHFIYSENVTPLANLQAMSLSAVTYSSSNLSGNLNATDFQGNLASGSVDMTVNFAADVIDTYSVNLTATSGTYGVTATNIGFSNLDQAFQLNDTGACAGTCSGEASVAFVGNAAEAAMSSFSIVDTTSGSGVSGTAVLTQP
jgi:hypothetical protein